jgi:hypothetical protein
MAAVVSTVILVVATLNVANADSALSNRDITAALAGVSDRLATPVGGTSDIDSIADNGTVDVRRDGTIHFRTKSAGDIVITLPYATKAEATNGGVTYRSANSATVTRLAGMGAQTLLVAANESAPTEYPFQVANGYVSNSSAGGLMLLDRNGSPVMPIPAPWAEDASGNTVMTRFVVDANQTGFTQVVEHRNGVSYPVVADPWMEYQPILWWPGNQKVGDRFTVYFDRFETANIAGAGAGVATSLLSRAGVPTAWLSVVSPVAVGIARQAAYQSGKCATLQFDLYWGWLPYTTSWVRNC